MRRAGWLVLILGWAITASAYVRTRTMAGTPIYWNGSCVFVQTDSTPPLDMALSEAQKIISRSIADWQTVSHDVGAAFLQIKEDKAAAVEAHYDHNNTVKFRADKWCRPAEPSNPEMCYSHDAAAITTIFYAADGSMVDADIELNQLDFTFVTLPSDTKARKGTMRADLENTLVHELGHLQGLDHTCWESTSSSKPPVDDQGKPVPSCDDVMAHKVSEAQYNKITEAVMYNFATPGETNKRMPKADDIAGIDGIYPAAKDPHRCLHIGERSGCSLGPSRGGAQVRGLLGMAALLARLWRRWRRC